MSELKHKLFAKQKPTLVPVEFCGEPCTVRKMTERDVIEWTVYIKEVKGKGEQVEGLIRCRAVASFLCDANGKSIFEVSEYAKLVDFDADELKKVFDLCFPDTGETDSKKSAATQS